MRRRLLVVAIWLAVAVAAASTPITVLYTNDLHLRFGRLASIGRLIDEVRADEPAVLLFDAGDTCRISGGPSRRSGAPTRWSSG